MGLKEQYIASDMLLSLAKRRFDYKPLSKTDLTTVLNRVISSGRVTELGQEFLIDCRELQWLKDDPNILVASSLEETRDHIGCLLTETSGQIGYITGGMEGLHLHWLLNGLTATTADTAATVDTFIIGIEEGSYVVAKGRCPLFSTNEKVALWETLAPERSIIFVIPKKA